MQSDETGREYGLHEKAEEEVPSLLPPFLKPFFRLLPDLERMLYRLQNLHPPVFLKSAGFEATSEFASG